MKVGLGWGEGWIRVWDQKATELQRPIVGFGWVGAGLGWVLGGFSRVGLVLLRVGLKCGVGLGCRVGVMLGFVCCVGLG